MMASEETTKAEDIPLPGGSFQLLVQKLGYQALLGMGVVDNPITKSRSINLQQARMVIDDLTMLREKTAGNLDDGEEQHLAKVLSDLEGHYSQLAGSEAK